MLKGLQWLSLVACCLLGTVIACVLMVQNWDKVSVIPTVQAQANTRTVIVDPPHRNDPIAVVKILAGGKEAVVGAPTADDLRWWPDGGYLPRMESRVAHRLPADDNWLKSLSFVLRNRTSKKIAALDILVLIPQEGGKMASEFSFGQLPAVAAYTGDGKPIAPTREPISFNPGQEMTFAVADDGIGLSRLTANALSPTSQVFVLFRVTLENGLSWMEYQWEKPVPGQPGQWVRTVGPYFPPNGLPGMAMNPHKSDN
jgi:hypothetical protein